MSSAEHPAAGPGDGGPRRRPPRAAAEVARRRRLLLAAPEVGGRLRRLTPLAVGGAWSGAMLYAGVWSAGAADGGAERPVVAKVAAGTREVCCTSALAVQAPDLIPTLYASGRHLGGEALPWMVAERCPYRLDYAWGDALFETLLDAGARFHLAGRTLAPAVGPGDVPLAAHHRLIRAGAGGPPPAPGPGAEVVARLEADAAWALGACRVELCHGDLHPGNAVWRVPPPDPASRALLIDFAPAASPWVAEPAYCQVLYWPVASRPGETGLVQRMAARRAAYGLEVPPPAALDRLATLYLAWNALRLWPLLTHRHGDPAYVAATREWIAAAAALPR